METRKLQLLFHPLFILSLACLLINDLYWKYEYHNWLTGKLSDFTGLFVFSVFLSAFFYRHRTMVYFGIAVFFIWWKSPLSQPAIDLLNQIFSLSLQRVIDYTDYVAIPFIFAPRLLKPGSYNFSWIKQVAVYFVSAICLFAFCSTSIYRKFMIAPDLGPTIEFSKSYPSLLNEESVLRRLDSMGINYKVDSFTIAPLKFYGGSLLIKKSDSLEKNILIVDPKQTDTVVYFRINERRYIAIYNFRVGKEIIPQVNLVVSINPRSYSKTNDIYLKLMIPDHYQFDDYIHKRGKTKKKYRRLIEKELIQKLQ